MADFWFRVLRSRLWAFGLGWFGAQVLGFGSWFKGFAEWGLAITTVYPVCSSPLWTYRETKGQLSVALLTGLNFNLPLRHLEMKEVKLLEL